MVQRSHVMVYLTKNIVEMLTPTIVAFVFARNYAVKATGTISLMSLGKGKKGAAGPAAKGSAVPKFIPSVETDPEKLINYLCGSNIMVTGEDIKLKPEEEYPEWLWTMYTGPMKKLEELDPSTKEYWLRVRADGRRRINRLKKIRGF